MAGPVIAVTENIFPTLAPAEQALAKLKPTFRMAKSTSAADILDVARDADAILVTYAKLPRELIMQLTRCKAIGRFGLGVDNIDLPAAKEKGIAVNYVPDYCIREVSDHAMALLLALIRKIPYSNRLVQAGRWEMPAVVPIRRIEGTVLGLIGFGNIPRLVAPKAKAFGMQVIAYDPFAKPELFAQTGVDGVDLDTLLARSDYISVHAPLTPQTRGMVNAQAFGKMKKGVYLVNTARGPLIDEAALIAALELGASGRRRARRGGGRAARQGFCPARPRQCDRHAAHRLLFDRGARRAAEQMRRRRRARAERREGGLSDRRMIPKKLVPDLLRDGNRFSEKIMRKMR